MHSAKFDLYKIEWLDFVFDHRNKAYGAYELRQHYKSTLAKALAITLAGVALFVALSLILKPKPPELVKITMVDLTPQLSRPVEPVKPIEPPKPAAPAPPVKSAPPVSTTRFVTPVIVSKGPTEEPPVISKIEGAIGNADVKVAGSGGIENVLDNSGTKGGTGTAPVVVPVADNTIHDFGGLEVMPEPVGGPSAWSGFLQKNLRFPITAQEQGVSGRVIMGFVIEKDGRLSNIAVEHSAGFGFDEEALRVLKLAKPWKPGVQNGQAVRVKYVIPIKFQLAEQ
ncbi:energy transducer TonB [Mucilaginibacter sp.]|uniref:energy transducer TonB n=1 Tax=Mucilaginibacter sp. TaxID=1882438 RepID=UPI0025DA489D|nr:energy transducer TonB [Mucilaginibacter sp.]